MLLSPGKRFGPYEILTPLGAGAMGEVYRARDVRLSREVAVKVLPPTFVTDPERLQRFEQEARAAAALSHPNVLAVYDVGQQDGAPYIISELLEGESLRDRLQAGVLPVRKAVEYAVQLAHGLAAAHEKGIIHRDLKPENVFVTGAGVVKILDFGLAKLTHLEPAISALSALPTSPALDHVPVGPDTSPGIVMGTLGYMSPEQVRGLTADRRSDIFALGAILYEMLSGQRAFKGETAVDCMTAILKDAPPLLPVPGRHLPQGLVRIVDRCLEKNPAARFQSTTDLAFALEGLSETEEQALSSGTQSRTVVLRPLPWLLAAVSFLIAVMLGVVLVRRPAPAGVVYRSAILTGASLSGNPAARLALSPDGRLAFVARDANGRVLLWVRNLDDLTPRPLAGTEGAGAPFWSPDGRYVAFFAAGKLKKIDSSGGPALTICDAPSSAVPGTWNQDDVILFTPRAGAGLFRVAAAGGTPAEVTVLDQKAGEVAHLYPFFLPDGQHFLYHVASPTTRQGIGIYVASLDSANRTLIIEGGGNAQYARGVLFFLREATLMAQPFDASNLRLTGDAIPMAEDVYGTVGAGVAGSTGAIMASGAGVFSVSASGILVYQGSASVNSQLVWLDRTGKQVGTFGDSAEYVDVELSRDGTQAAVSIVDRATRNTDIWIYDVARGLPTRFTHDQSDDVMPLWSRPDGKRLVFMSRRQNVFDLFERTIGSSNAEKEIWKDHLTKYPLSWSPDGRYILVATGGASTGNDLFVVSTSDGTARSVFLQTAFNEGYGQFSPDGRWIAYSSNETGQNEIYVTSFPAPAGKWRISTAGGLAPRWRRDGREIFYRVGDQLMAATVDGNGQSFVVGVERSLFDAKLPATRVRGYGPFNYDVSLDGDRFLVNMRVGNPDANPITLVVNWPTLATK